MEDSFKMSLGDRYEEQWYAVMRSQMEKLQNVNFQASGNAACEPTKAAGALAHKGLSTIITLPSKK